MGASIDKYVQIFNKQRKSIAVMPEYVLNVAGLLKPSELMLAVSDHCVWMCGLDLVALLLPLFT